MGLMKSGSSTVYGGLSYFKRQALKTRPNLKWWKSSAIDRKTGNVFFGGFFYSIKALLSNLIDICETTNASLQYILASMVSQKNTKKKSEKTYKTTWQHEGIGYLFRHMLPIPVSALL